MAEEEARKAEEQGDPGKAEGKKPGESAWAGLLTDAAKRLMPIFLTGASLLGFVAFAGAVIVWTRFDAIGVPPDQAVRAVPRDELVATGSSLLLIFGFFGVLAVLATYLVDRGGRATPGMSRILLLVVAVEGIIAIVLASDTSTMLKLALIIGFLVLIGIAVVSTFDKSFAKYVDQLPDLDEETEAPVRGPDALHTEGGDLRIAVWKLHLIVCVAGVFAALVSLLVFQDLPALWWPGVLVVTVVAGQALLTSILLALAETEASRNAEAAAEEARRKAKKKEEEEKWMGLYLPVRKWIKGLFPEKIEEESRGSKEAERIHRRRPHRLELRFWGVCLLLVLAVATIVVPAVSVGQWWLAASFATAYLFAAGVWRVAVLSKPSFMWYGFAVFISVPLFGTCTLMAHNVAAPQVQPMALIRSTDGPGEAIQGIYVTEGSDRVYFASVATEGCQEKLTPDSGRLQWVPKSELVAMSVGPLQDVDKAGKAALEMAAALTPSIETPSGEKVSLAPVPQAGGAGVEMTVTESGRLPVKSQGKDGDEEGGDEDEGGKDEKKAAGEDAKGEGAKAGDEGEGKAGGEEEKDEEATEPDKAEEAALDRRLAGAGPAIRPNFGTGLKLIPAAAEPGDVVELRMSAPNTADGVDGFGETPKGHDLRLNGVRLAVLRVPVEDPRRAEYVKTVGGRVLPIADYVKVEEDEVTTEFVRLESDAVHSVSDADTDRGNFTLKVTAGGKLVPLPAAGKGASKEEAPTVILPNGEEEQLEDVLLRRSWSPTGIKFRVPSAAKSGVVSVECGQLAGQPVLDVVHPPVARIAVRVHPGTERLTFDSRRSTDEGKALLSHRWTVSGRRMGDRPMVSTELPPRLVPYEVSLTVSNKSGLSDRVDLRVWRLPSAHLRGGLAKRAKRVRYQRRVRHALEAAVSEQKPVAIELDGHADLKRAEVSSSLAEAKRVRRLLFAPREGRPHNNTSESGGTEAPPGAAQERKASGEKPLLNGGPAVPLLLRAFGESCPIVRHPGPQPVNSRVEIFLLGPGATVGKGKHCHAARSSRGSW